MKATAMSTAHAIAVLTSAAPVLDARTAEVGSKTNILAFGDVDPVDGSFTFAAGIWGGVTADNPMILLTMPENLVGWVKDAGIDRWSVAAQVHVFTSEEDYEAWRANDDPALRNSPPLSSVWIAAWGPDNREGEVSALTDLTFVRVH